MSPRRDRAGRETLPNSETPYRISLASALALTCWITLVSCAGSEAERTPSGRGGDVPSLSAGVPTLEELANGTYAGVFDEPVRLIEGRFEGTPFVEGGSSRPTLMMLDRQPLFADLDGDGRNEAVVALAESSGGSGTWIHLAVVGSNGGEARSVAVAALGDRVHVGSLEVADGRLVADLLEHAPGDALCCPTRAIRREWALEWGRLVEGEAFRGYFVWGHEVRSFTPCGSNRESWVADRTGGELAEVHRELTSRPYQRLFVELRGSEGAAPTQGFGIGLASELAVIRLVRAEAEGPGCDRDLSGFDFRALGNEPFWSLEIGERIVLSRPGEAERVFPRSAEPTVGAGGVVFVSEGGSQEAVRVELTETRCVDSMSGSRYNWAARAQIGDEALEGCAFQGTSARG